VIPRQPVAHPDVEALVCSHLRYRLDRAVKVSTDLTGWRSGPAVTLWRVGGQRVGLFDHSSMQVQVRHHTHAEAVALTERVRSLLMGMPLEQAAVTLCEELAGPAWQPDPSDDCPRVVLTVEVRTRPQTPADAAGTTTTTDLS